MAVFVSKAFPAVCLAVFVSEAFPVVCSGFLWLGLRVRLLLGPLLVLFLGCGLVGLFCSDSVLGVVSFSEGVFSSAVVFFGLFLRGLRFWLLLRLGRSLLFLLRLLRGFSSELLFLVVFVLPAVDVVVMSSELPTSLCQKRWIRLDDDFLLRTGAGASGRNSLMAGFSATCDDF